MADLGRTPLADARYRKAVLAHGGEGGTAACSACMHRCLLGEGERGRCGVRYNKGGSLMALWGYLSYARLDPVERKPLYHFYPGSSVYSIGTVGCNFTCPFCQNHAISCEYGSYPLTRASPSMVVRMARRKGAQGVAFSFNEPAVTPEYVHDVAHLAKKKGLYTVLVTNGYLTPEAVSYLAPTIDAASIGFKPFDAQYYADILGASLESAMEGARALCRMIPHVECSYMVKENDTAFGPFLDFLSSLGREIPLQLERFFPSYRARDPETSKEKLVSYYEAAQRRGLPYVYISDIHDATYERTCCPACGETVIDREGSLIEPSVSCHCALHAVTDCRMGPDGLCPSCGEKILLSGTATRQD